MTSDITTKKSKYQNFVFAYNINEGGIVMHDFQWNLMKDFLQTGNIGSLRLYQDLTMSEELFNAKFPLYEETEERVL